MFQKEGVDIEKLLIDNERRAKEIRTGTTEDSFLDAITEGFKNGLSSAADFAQTFEGFMKGAILNSLKFKFLQEPLKKLFDEFDAAAKSGDELTDTEIADLKAKYDAIIATADKQFKDLQKIAGVNFDPAAAGVAGAGDNSLKGAIKGITEETAGLLAGQFGGLRITALGQLEKATQSLSELQRIEFNTSQALIQLGGIKGVLDAVTTNTKQFYIK